MDYLQAKRLKETTLVVLVGLTALVANLPADLLPRGFDARYLLAVLGVLVVLALFLYVRFFFFLVYILLAAGANLPDQWADSLGLSRIPLMVALGTMVLFSLINNFTKTLPSGLEPAKQRKQSPQGIRGLVHAIEKGQSAQVPQYLRLDFDLNMLDDKGTSPLMAAAAKGDLATVELLLAAGADPAMAGKDGHTARDLALRHGHGLLVERLTAGVSSAAELLAEPAAAIN